MAATATSKISPPHNYGPVGSLVDPVAVVLGRCRGLCDQSGAAARFPETKKARCPLVFFFLFFCFSLSDSSISPRRVGTFQVAQTLLRENARWEGLQHSLEENVVSFRLCVSNSTMIPHFICLLQMA